MLLKIMLELGTKEAPPAAAALEELLPTYSVCLF